ncbi:hypothetical protein QS460_05105 [Liquorilactobacillus mali]|uniref:hypothetical protein n=1 Tax=Liquorilactobacillus mali TaxID=1618 RepID=UPI00265353CA|nr:hypothetical protein [Liquorilactobacillus mali]MDN7145303.1 hypothetical protein [Liquorilactobacillus mali]
MLSKTDFFKILTVTEAMLTDLKEIGNLERMLIKTIKYNNTSLNTSIAEVQLSELERVMQRDQSLQKELSVLCEMLDEFLESNFDWCCEHLNDEQQILMGLK